MKTLCPGNLICIRVDCIDVLCEIGLSHKIFRESVVDGLKSGFRNRSRPSVTPHIYLRYIMVSTAATLADYNLWVDVKCRRRAASQPAFDVVYGITSEFGCRKHS